MRYIGIVLLLFTIAFVVFLIVATVQAFFQGAFAYSNITQCITVDKNIINCNVTIIIEPPKHEDGEPNINFPIEGERPWYEQGENSTQ